MNHPTPLDALKTYRRQSPDFVREQAERFAQLPIQDQLELLFYMSVHISNAMAEIGKEVDYTVEVLAVDKDN